MFLSELTRIFQVLYKMKKLFDQLFIAFDVSKSGTYLLFARVDGRIGRFKVHIALTLLIVFVTKVSFTKR